MLDGYYKARFTNADGANFLGLVALAKGKLFGGNSEIMLLGNYTQSGYDLSADVQVSRLSMDQATGMFREGGSLNLVGRGGLQNIMCECRSPQYPDGRMQVVLDRVQF